MIVEMIAMLTASRIIGDYSQRDINTVSAERVFRGGLMKSVVASQHQSVPQEQVEGYVQSAGKRAKFETRGRCGRPV